MPEQSKNDEIWKAVPGFPGYDASTLGRIRSHRRLKLTVLSSKDRVNLRKNGKTYPFRVSCVVALTFLGKRPRGHCVRHLNDDRLNNTLTNLSYGTYKDNADDAKRNGIKVGRPFTKTPSAETLRKRKRLGYTIHHMGDK